MSLPSCLPGSASLALRLLSSVCFLAVAAARLPAAAQTADEARLLRLARDAVRAAATSGAPPVPPPAGAPARPVFVTIEQRRGQVVGCRGALVCRGRTLEEEVVRTARAAASHDPRYKPLTPRDLSDFLVTVTVVSRLEPLAARDIATLAPGDGLVLRAGERTGIVLPWEGKDPRVRLGWAYKKAGVPPGSACTLQRMTAERFRG